jgi:pimeloyl-ACP methyl ester carboxylesterase
MTAKIRRAAAGGVKLRRMYVDCRYGQLHLVTAFAPTGGFDEHTPLLLLHDDGGKAADFNPCSLLFGSDRSVYAPDLPGSGASDSPTGRVSIADLAMAITDLLDQLRLHEVDVVGCGRGALVASELASMRRLQVRRVVIAGDPPAVLPLQPLLHLGNDATLVFHAPVAPVIARIREFLDG